MIGLNYKDKFNNAEKFLNELGNPYNIILLDEMESSNRMGSVWCS